MKSRRRTSAKVSTRRVVVVGLASACASQLFRGRVEFEGADRPETVDPGKDVRNGWIPGEVCDRTANVILGQALGWAERSRVVLERSHGDVSRRRTSSYRLNEFHRVVQNDDITVGLNVRENDH